MATADKKRFHIKTFGCQMNYHDTERMAYHLHNSNYQATEDPFLADLIIFNTCSIRDKSHHKGISGLGRFKKIKKNNPNLRIGFAGCVAQHDGKEVLKSFPFIDFVMGTDQIDNLPEILYQLDHGQKDVVMLDFDSSQDYSIETKLLPGKASAFVNIMKGCDNFCSYCIVPFTRGREKSRAIAEVVEDVEKLLRKGIVEITLLGQNVNSYGKSLGGSKNNQTFARLLREIEAMADRLDSTGVTDPTGRSKKTRGLRYLRYTTSHPKDFDEEVIEVHGDLKRLVPHLHLPVQSGSPKILKAMKRYLPIEEYIRRVELLREKVPSIALTSDIIVGFPGEEEEDFQETIALIEKIRFDGIYAYAYSPRPGTNALKLGDTVSKELKSQRLLFLQEKQNPIQKELNHRFISTVEHLLVEGASKSNSKFATGRTRYGKVLNFPLPEDSSSAYYLRGKIVPVRVTEATAFALKGELYTQ